MPLYEYHCKDCGTSFEKMVRFSESNQSQACPTCHSEKTRKKVSAAAALGVSLSFSAASSSSSSNCGSGGGFR